jgi:hypothetical protein
MSMTAPKPQPPDPWSSSKHYPDFLQRFGASPNSGTASITTDSVLVQVHAKMPSVQARVHAELSNLGPRLARHLYLVRASEHSGADTARLVWTLLVRAGLNPNPDHNPKTRKTHEWMTGDCIFILFPEDTNGQVTMRCITAYVAADWDPLPLCPI